METEGSSHQRFTLQEGEILVIKTGGSIENISQPIPSSDQWASAWGESTTDVLAHEAALEQQSQEMKENEDSFNHLSPTMRQVRKWILIGGVAITTLVYISSQVH